MAKPVFTADNGDVRVIGIVMVARPETRTGLNLTAVWFRRPERDCQDLWEAKVHVGASAWEVVQEVKAETGASDFQDLAWEVDSDGGDAGSSSESAYRGGFLLADPAAQVAEGVSDRGGLLSALKEAGAPVADIPFESGGGPGARLWLARHAQFWDRVIGGAFTPEQWSFEISEHLIESSPLVVARLRPCVTPIPGDPGHLDFPTGRGAQPPLCAPTTIYGDWVPQAQLCDCRTLGPTPAACGTFTANANGEITIWIPFPLPRGTTITLGAGVGTSITTCVCVWTRVCKANACRSATRINADCSRTALPQPCQVVEYRKVVWNLAATPEFLTGAAPPAGMPPNEQPCDLENPVVESAPSP